ncbi:MAG: magnesium transporter [Gammaproteobacteria bacterium]|nr:magnesium transporter [Gammaproteobacteria bacterium]
MTETNGVDPHLDLLERVEAALSSGAEAKVREELAALHPAEIADLIEAMPTPGRASLWRLVAPGIAGEVLSHAQDSVRAAILGQMTPGEIATVTAGVDTDDAADILQDLPEMVVAEVLLTLDDLRRKRLTAVLSWPEDTAGGLMNLDATTVREDVSIEVVLRFLRRRGPLAQRTDCLFVVDRGQHYLGCLPLTVVLSADPAEQVAAVMDRDIAGIEASRPAAEVAKLFERRDLLSAPVVDADKRLLGRITIDDVVDVIREQGEHSLMGMAGLDEDDDMFEPALRSAKRRAVWLGVNLVTAFITAWVIGRFQNTIQTIVALAVLMPIVASMGGIAGSQTLTIVVRGLALGQVGAANARALLAKEMAVAAILGGALAATVGVVTAVWFDDRGLGLVISMALLANLITAACAGTLVPLALQRFAIDPAIAGGVVLTTVTDVVGFAAFLGTATVLLI